MKADFKKWLKDNGSEAIPFAEDIAYINSFAEDFAQQEAIELRTPLKDFALVMESILKENDHKGGWEWDTPQQLMTRLDEEVGELHQAFRDNDPYLVQKELVDVANFCMMIYDVINNKHE